MGANGAVEALAASSSRLYVGGSFSRVNGRAHSNLAAVALANGAPCRRVDGADERRGARPPLQHSNGSCVRRRPLLERRRRGATVPCRRRRQIGVSVSLGEHAAGAGLGARAELKRPTLRGVGGHQGGQLDSYRPLTGRRRWHHFADGDVQTVAIAGSEILAGGHFLNACRGGGGGSPWVCTTPVQRDRLFATNTSGALQPWDPGANSLYGVWALRADAGHVDAGGDFTIVHQTHQARYVEFLR